MSDEHPNLSVLKRFNPADVAGSVDVFSEDVVFHFFNPALPDLEGDYIGREGLQTFFSKMAETTKGSFKVNPVSTTAVGDELVVVHVKNTMTLADQRIEIDVVVVWRILEGFIVEVWDIPAVHTPKTIRT